MKSLTLFIVFLFCFYSCDHEPFELKACDNGTYIGRVSLNTQQQVNDFGARCYTKIDGVLQILDRYVEEDKIVDLTPLINLQEVYSETYPDSLLGSVHISTSLLENLEGLNNLRKVSRLLIFENDHLVDLKGLEGLHSIDGLNQALNYNSHSNGWNYLQIQNNNSLQSLNGLNNLTHIGYEGYMSNVKIIGNAVLQNIDGLQSLTRIGSSSYPYPGIFGSTYLDVHGNHELQNLNGLSNLLEVHGFLNFVFTNDWPTVVSTGNNNLTDYCGLQNIVLNGIYYDLYLGGPNQDSYYPSVQEIIDGNCSQ